MDKLYMNIGGIILLITAIIFIARFYKNHHTIEPSALEEVKMKVKVNMQKPDYSNFGNNTPPSFTTTETKQDANPISNRDPIFISLETTNIINDKRLLYIGTTPNTRFPIYAILEGDLTLLKGTKYNMIKNINSVLNCSYLTPSKKEHIIKSLMESKKKTSYSK